MITETNVTLEQYGAISKHKQTPTQVTSALCTDNPSYHITIRQQKSFITFNA